MAGPTNARQHLREEPDALAAHVRICAGGPQQCGFLPRYSTWHRGDDTCKSGFGAPCQGVALARSQFAAISMRARPTRERGRLARIGLGTEVTNPAREGSAQLAKEWPGSQPVRSNKDACESHPGARASRPQRTWYRGDDTCKAGSAHPAKEWPWIAACSHQEGRVGDPPGSAGVSPASARLTGEA